ncbi:twin-arginine translocase subunit TatB [Nitratireductor mangrovi]|uniref:Sec-independent protein translocase protein TatB n=1 Tax=Nitratireductor mangrovi TaxID=2599600 RepID=A0A5B8KUF7_9HYPH|nr:Sec-independent protein translocase protein TatB [Nitratireductor mangrovi]QDY99218.1 twin-arginine translocase subunit TatB [Nitratireductor mangrovi]
MFDIGWPEMLVIAIVLIVVVGPKDLPRMLRTFGRTTTKLRSMAGDFRKQFDEALKEAELDDVKSTIDSARKLNPTSEIKKALNPMEKAAADVRAGLDDLMKPQPAKTQAPDAPAQATAPAKAGATAMPGEGTASAAKAADGAAAAASGGASAKTAATGAASSKTTSAAKAGGNGAAKAPAKGTSKTAAKKTAAAKPAASKPAPAKKPAEKKPAATKKTGATS